jgi:hypothetical protein
VPACVLTGSTARTGNGPHRPHQSCPGTRNARMGGGFEMHPTPAAIHLRTLQPSTFELYSHGNPSPPPTTAPSRPKPTNMGAPRAAFRLLICPLYSSSRLQFVAATVRRGSSRPTGKCSRRYLREKMLVGGGVRGGGRRSQNRVPTTNVQPATGAESEAEEAPPRSERAGRAGSRRARPRTSGGAAASGINWG